MHAQITCETTAGDPGAYPITVVVNGTDAGTSRTNFLMNSDHTPSGCLAWPRARATGHGWRLSAARSACRSYWTGLSTPCQQDAPHV